MSNVAGMTAIELAGFVGDHLAKHNIDVVLSSGMCVAYYSEGKYVSMDLFLAVRLCLRTRTRNYCR